MKSAIRFMFFLMALSVNSSALWAMNKEGSSESKRIKPCLKRGREAGLENCSPNKRAKTVLDNKENQSPNKRRKNVRFNDNLAATHTFAVTPEYSQVKRDRLLVIGSQQKELEENEDTEESNDTEEELDKDKPCAQKTTVEPLSAEAQILAEYNHLLGVMKDQFTNAHQLPVEAHSDDYYGDLGSSESTFDAHGDM